MYQLLPVLHRLQVLLLPFLGLILLLQVGFDGLVLGVEVTHVLQTHCYTNESTKLSTQVAAAQMIEVVDYQSNGSADRSQAPPIHVSKYVCESLTFYCNYNFGFQRLL